MDPRLVFSQANLTVRAGETRRLHVLFIFTAGGAAFHRGAKQACVGLRTHARTPTTWSVDTETNVTRVSHLVARYLPSTM